MERETKIKLAYRVALISGIFCGVVALLLILNFWHMKQNEPLESKTIEVLVERLSQEPNNEELKEEIRSFDLLARKAYFTSRWQVRTGTYLMLVSGILLAVSLKVFTDLRARIEEPSAVTEELLRARANAQYWVLTTGGVVLGLALISGWLNNDFLKQYQAMGGPVTSSVAQGGVEVIDVFGTDSTAGAFTDSTGMFQEGAAQESARGGAAVTPAGQTTAPASPAVPFNRENFRKNQANFRGYMGHGVSYSRNIPVRWNVATGENVVWKVPFSKPGQNSPVIWDDKLFISGADETARIVACYNRLTGQLLWEREVNNIPGSPSAMPNVSVDTGLAAPTTCVDGNRVYAIFATGDVIAFDLNGNRVWARNLGVPNNSYGHSSSLMVWGNKLVVQYDSMGRGRMLALNTSNGQTIWDVSRPVNITWSSPILIEVDGKIQIVTTADPYISGHDLETGAELWKIQALFGEVGPSAAYDDGLVFASQEYARTVAVRPGGTSFVWEEDEYISEVGSPVAFQGLFYLATTYGVVVCYDARTGEKVWEKDFGGSFYSSPMVADGKLYVMDVKGNMRIMRADRTGTVIAEPQLGDEGYAQPAFADGYIYLKGWEYLYCIGQ